MNPQRLLERIVAQRDSDSVTTGALTNRLLREFQRGYPLENLRRYLRSDQARLVAIGVWIASELGQTAKPLLDDVSALLTHPLKRVRFFSIDCVLLWAGPSDGCALASVIALMDDAETAVRWKVLDFLSRASREQLQGALSYLLITEPKSRHIPGLKWMLSSDLKKPKEVIAALHNQDSLTRRYGVVAAVRMSKDNPQPLFDASSVEDSDVKAFADSGIRLL
jgi:hypothetical protein